MKKKYMTVVGLVLMVVFVFGINVGATTLRLLSSDTLEEVPKLYAQCMEYAEQTGIEIVWNVAPPDPGVIASSLVPAFEAEETPADVIMLPFLGVLREFALKGYLVDMSEMAGAIDAKWGWSPGVLAPCTVPGTDKVFGIPREAYVNSIGLYRISLFEEQGLESPRTWDEFLDVCKKLKSLTGKPLIATAGYYGTRLLFEHLMLSFASKKTWDDFTFGRIKASDDKIKKVLGRLALLKEMGYAAGPMNEPEMMWGWWLGEYPIGLRQPGMVGMLGPTISRDEAYKDQGYFTISGGPLLPGGYCAAMTTSVISKSSPVIEEAKDFLIWLSAPEQFEERNQAGNLSVIEAVDPGNLHPESARIMEALKGCALCFDISDMVGGEWAHTLDTQTEMLFIKGMDYLDEAIEKIDAEPNPLAS